MFFRFISRRIPVLQSTMDRFKYSKNLINKTIEVFKKEDNLDISPEIACEFLDSLGDLFLAFADLETSAGAFSVAEVSCADPFPKVERVFTDPKTTRGVGPDLITPHSCNK